MSYSPAKSEQPRVISLLGGFAVVAGSMLGIGIFLSPPIVAANTGSLPLFFALWILGGVISLAGAVACAELGTMIPRAGGDYVFQYEAFGPSVAFASGWVLFIAIFSGSIATMAVGLCQYQLPVLLGMDLSGPFIALPWSSFALSGSQFAAIVLVVGLTWLNTMGASPSARTQTVLTLVPITVLAIMSAYAIVTGDHTTGASSVAPARSAGAGGLTLNSFVVSYMAVYFAYSGWINIIYVAGEVENPKRNIPRSLILGTLVVTVLYLLMCLGFTRVLGLSGLSDAGEAGTATAAILAGGTGRILIALLIASALLASINGTVLGGARVAYAMGKKRAMWPRLGTVGLHHHAPNSALWLQAGLAVVLVVSGRFEQLYSMVSLAMVVTGTITVSSLFALRMSKPDAPRPYRATGYPLIPGLYIVASIFVVVVSVGNVFSGERGAWYPLLGIGILILAYFYHRVVLSKRIEGLESPEPVEPTR